MGQGLFSTRGVWREVINWLLGGDLLTQRLILLCLLKIFLNLIKKKIHLGIKSPRSSTNTSSYRKLISVDAIWATRYKDTCKPCFSDISLNVLYLSKTCRLKITLQGFLHPPNYMIINNSLHHKVFFFWLLMGRLVPVHYLLYFRLRTTPQLRLIQMYR